MTEYKAGTLTLGPGGGSATIAFENPADEARLRSLLIERGGQALPVQLTAAEDSDVEGHSTSSSVELTIRFGEDDVTGHALSVHFPTVEDAARLRRNLIAGGLLAGSIVLGSAGAIAISGQLGAPASTAPVERGQVYERPAGRGALEGVDMEAPAVILPAQAGGATLDEATGRPAGTGMLEGEDGPAAGGQADTTRRVGGGLLEGVDE